MPKTLLRKDHDTGYPNVSCRLTPVSFPLQRKSEKTSPIHVLCWLATSPGCTNKQQAPTHQDGGEDGTALFQTALLYMQHIYRTMTRATELARDRLQPDGSTHAIWSGFPHSFSYADGIRHDCIVQILGLVPGLARSALGLESGPRLLCNVSVLSSLGIGKAGVGEGVLCRAGLDLFGAPASVGIPARENTTNQHACASGKVDELMRDGDKTAVVVLTSCSRVARCWGCIPKRRIRYR